MTAFDRLLEELRAELQRLDHSATAAFFLLCGRALRPLYRAWLERTGSEDRSPLLDGVAEAVAGWTEAHLGAADASELLVDVEQATPSGEAIDGVPAVGAQACWICHDVALRQLIQPDFDAGPCVEYALEPLTASVSERLFGVSQIGAVPDEDRQAMAIVDDDRIQAAVVWIRETIATLASGGILDAVDDDHPLRP